MPDLISARPPVTHSFLRLFGPGAPAYDRTMEYAADFGPFLLIFAAALLGAKLLGEVALRAGQPSVLGELLAGVILGPSVLGLVPLTTSVLLVAEIGVVSIYFQRKEMSLI